jgi:hypothetical protein
MFLWVISTALGVMVFRDPNMRVLLVGLLPAFPFVKSQQPNQRGWLSSKATLKSNFWVVQI